MIKGSNVLAGNFPVLTRQIQVAAEQNRIIGLMPVPPGLYIERLIGFLTQRASTRNKIDPH
jgi:hypothetical protein